METLITILIFIGIAIFSSWLKRRQQADEDQPWPTSPTKRSTPPPSAPASQRPAQPRPTKSVSWEEELRRLLEGEQPAAPPPPPVIVHEPRRVPAPPPLPTAPARPTRPAARPVITPVLEIDEEQVGIPVQLPGLTESASAYERATQLDLKVAERLRQASDQVTKHSVTPVARTERRQGTAVAALFRDRTSLRAAMIASFVLGPPKAIET
jgi:hypothetical protein